MKLLSGHAVTTVIITVVCLSLAPLIALATDNVKPNVPVSQSSKTIDFAKLKKDAEAGDTNAMIGIGFCYAEGESIPKNDVYAYMWLSLAAARDDGYAFFRDKTRARLTPEQVAEAQKLATAFSEKRGRSTNAAPGDTLRKNTDPSATGSGFFVTVDGYLLTASHVVAKTDKVEVLFKGKVLDAKVIRLDAANDVALLKVEGSFTALAVILSRGVKLGMDVFSVVFPNIDLQGAAPKLTKGSVNALSGIQDDPRAFQISVPVQPGNSGGPLLDAAGNVIGVVVPQLDAVKTARITGSLPQGVNYAVKSAYVQPLLDAIPDTSALPSIGKPRSFEDAVRAAEAAVCVVMAY